MDKKGLIEKFLANKCSEQETELVFQILESEPELLSEYLPSEEWETTENAEIKPDTVLKAEIWQGIKATIRKGKLYHLFIRSATIAASILLLITVVFYLTPSRRVPAKEIARSAIHFDSLQLAQNNSDKTRTLKLADGSEVTLYPHSSIKYSLDFKNNRTIQLITGKAGFDVAKDPKHPFTVLSGSVSTTALGTKFIVDHTGDKVNVRLYEGKVVVKSLVAKAAIQPAFLTPGEQCVINTKMNDVVVGALQNELFEDVLKNTTNISVKNLTGPGISIKFYNTPLTEVFERLKIIFNRRIIFNDREMERMFFTGQFTSSDSITSILKTLTSVNGLTTSTEGDVIKITRLATSKPENVVTEMNVISKNGQIKNSKPVVHPKKSIETETLTYTSAPLEQVFNEMKKKFHILIKFQPEDIKGKYFTGTITFQNDPEKVLSLICSMNQLRIIKHLNDYQVMK